jgi:hypothetical protein
MDSEAPKTLEKVTKAAAAKCCVFTKKKKHSGATFRLSLFSKQTNWKKYSCREEK